MVDAGYSIRLFLGHSLLVIFIFLIAHRAEAQQERPNIILFFTDDQGWTDTSVQMMAGRADSKSDFYQTPALERLARDGMVFSNAYSPSPVCTPSRASIQFGKTTARLRQTTVHDVLAKNRGIDLKSETSLAQMIKTADMGYSTAHFGKWGFPPRSPEHAGYDFSDGGTNNGDGDYADVHKRTLLPEDDPKRIFSLTKRANAFMEKQTKAGRPFFLQVSHYAVHVQHYALKATIEKHKKLPRGKKGLDMDYRAPLPSRNAWMMNYSAMIEDLDTSLGLMLDKLDELQIADNTYVIFTSDNGSGFRGNEPLKGGKANLWEGGLRVPFVVRGPGVRKGSYCDKPVAGWDIYPTVRDLIGSKKPLPDGIDGGSLRSLLEKGNEGEVVRGFPGLVFHFPWYGNVPMTAIRVGDYKLMRHLNNGEHRLFNVSNDIEEQRDLSKTMPKKAKELLNDLDAYLKEVGAENIEDMRDARVNELIRYTARTNEEIKQTLALLNGTASDERKKQLEVALADHRRHLRIHQAGMERLEKAKMMMDW